MRRPRDDPFRQPGCLDRGGRETRGFASPAFTGFALIVQSLLCVLDQIIEGDMKFSPTKQAEFDYSFDSHLLVLAGDSKRKILRWLKHGSANKAGYSRLRCQYVLNNQ